MIIKVKSGDSVGKTIRQLRENGYINSELRFKILAYLYDYNPIFKNGTYRVKKGDTEYSLLRKLINGKVIQEQITIIEGSTYSDIKQTLLNNSKIDFNNPFEIKNKINKIKNFSYQKSKKIRTEKISKLASKIAIHDFVREYINSLQYQFVKKYCHFLANLLF